MKKNIACLSTLIIVIFTMIIIAACPFSLSDKENYTFNGFSYDSISTVTGKKEKLTAVGTGTNIGGTSSGKYQYKFYSFNNNDDRDSAAYKYIDYFVDTLGFTALSAYTFKANDNNIIISYGKNDNGKIINIGIDTQENKTIKFCVIVN